MLASDSGDRSYNVPDYIWVPPATLSEFHKLPATGTVSTDTRKPPLTEFEMAPNQDEGPNRGEPAAKVPHPLSDYSHFEPDTEYFERNKATLEIAPGFQRLSALYTFLLNKVVDALDNLNKATKDEDYALRRREYLELVEDLDDHEQSQNAEPGRRGYGKVIKWLDIRPTIAQPNGGPSQIVSVRFVVKWNPHSSSSAVHVP